VFLAWKKLLAGHRLGTNDLSERFARPRAVKDLNLEVRRRGVFGFLGPNGAEKIARESWKAMSRNLRVVSEQ